VDPGMTILGRDKYLAYPIGDIKPAARSVGFGSWTIYNQLREKRGDTLLRSYLC